MCKVILNTIRSNIQVHLSDDRSSLRIQKKDSYLQDIVEDLDTNSKKEQLGHVKLNPNYDRDEFRCTILQKAATSGCINKTKYVINKIMDAREKHQKNMYFCKYTIFENI